MAGDVLQDDPLDDFSRRKFAHGDLDFDVLSSGNGIGVIIMPEMPGISPPVARFARHVRDAGFRVFVPSLFGRDGAVARTQEGVAVFQRTCVQAAFIAAADGERPVVHWLRALAREVHAACGGRGVGAVGMCFTGNFALSMVLSAPVTAPVMCQPSLPMEDQAATGFDDAMLAVLNRALARKNASVLGLRFAGDRWCTASRFAGFRAGLKDRFREIVVADAAANPDPAPFFKEVVGTPHSVVTAHLIDAAGEPTAAARDAVIAFLKEGLS